MTDGSGGGTTGFGRAGMVQTFTLCSVEDMRRLMPLLEGTLSESGLDRDTAVRLVEFVVSLPWPDHWVSRALDWVDEGLWTDAIRDALQPISQDKNFSQQTRHRAWRYVKPRNR
jgi:hypothetical protein